MHKTVCGEDSVIGEQNTNGGEGTVASVAHRRDAFSPGGRESVACWRVERGPRGASFQPADVIEFLHIEEMLLLAMSTKSLIL